MSDHIPDTGRMVERLARAICRETCAFYGDPPCWQMAADHPDELDWPNRECDEPGCMALAAAAASVIAEPPADE